MGFGRTVLVAMVLTELLAPVVGARTRSGTIALRKKLDVDPLITEPDVLEFDLGGAFSTGGSFNLPSSIRFTPEGTHLYWGRTEFSAGFDSAVSVTDGFARTTNFGDRVTVAATTVLKDGKYLDLAFAPQASFLVRGDSGVRLGGTLIARLDLGRHNLNSTVSWSTATAASASNPSGLLDVGVGYGVRLAHGGALSHLTPHVNWLYEKATGVTRTLGVFEGVEYQISDRFALDFSVLHLNVVGGKIDHQLGINLSVNTGRLHPK